MPIQQRHAQADRSITWFTTAGAWTWAELYRFANVWRINLGASAVPAAVAVLDLRGARMPAGSVGHVRSLGGASSLFAHQKVRGLVLLGIDAATQEAVGAQAGLLPGTAFPLWFAADETDADARARRLLQDPA
jgi:hypothetical protein